MLIDTHQDLAPLFRHIKTPFKLYSQIVDAKHFSLNVHKMTADNVKLYIKLCLFETKNWDLNNRKGR